MPNQDHLFLLSLSQQELDRRITTESIASLDFSAYDFVQNQLRYPIPTQMRGLVFRVPVDFSGCTFPPDFAIQNVQFLAPANFARCTFKGLFTLNNVHPFLPSLVECNFEGLVQIENLPMGTAVPLTMRDGRFAGAVTIIQNQLTGIILAGSKFDGAVEVAATVGGIADFANVED